MSDVPPNQTDTLDGDATPFQGGWNAPQTPGTWREPEESPEAEGWKVPVLPKDMPAEPEDTGAWHLPSPDDTTFSPEDEIEITESRRPEDELLELAALVSADIEAEKVTEEAAESNVPMAPEDLMYLIEHVDDEEEQENPQMSELIALASLVDDEAIGDLDDSSIQAIVVADEGEDEKSQEGLSAAEKLILGSSGADGARTQMRDDNTVGDPTADPQAYARAQLEQLGLSDDDPLATVDVTDDITGQMSATSASDPEAYARAQLEQLASGGSGDFAAPPVAEPVDPRQVELGRQFRQTEEQVSTLRQMAQNGQIPQEDYVNQLRQMMIRDDEGVWWMMGVDSNQWYRAENNDWVQADPEPLAALREYERQQQSGNGGSSQQYIVDDSLPYLDDQPMTERSGEPSSSIRLDENFMPLPDPATIDDPDATIASPSAFGGDLNYGNETVPSAAHFDNTVAAQPVDYGLIESPYEEEYEEDVIPDYDLESAQGEIYERALETRRSNQARFAITFAALIFLGAVVLTVGTIVLATSWYSGIVNDFEPQIAGILDVERTTLQTVSVLDRDGDEIASIAPEGDDRRPLRSLDEVSPFVIHAFLTLEDRTYFENPGWNFTSTLRAFVQNYTSGEITSGASTITQQVARNMVVGSVEQTAERKVNEIIVSAELTERYSKDDILLLYLNEVTFFGNQTYGIEAAAQFYFDKSAAELNIAEAAFLANIPQNPLNNEPINNRETANQLMLATLDVMEQVGCLQINAAGEQLCVTEDLIDPRDVALAQVEPFRVRGGEGLGDYPHFTQLVLNSLGDEYLSDIFSGGYTITTTLDSDLQESAQDLLRSRVTELNGINTGAVMVTDPRTGEILAMVGSPDFEDDEVNGQFNFALGYNRPGSTIKPIVYGAALRGVDRNINGLVDFGEYYTPATILWDVPIAYDIGSAQPYQPVNIDGAYRGNVTVRQALQQSLNIPAVEAYAFIGAEVFQQIGERLGIRFLDDATFGLAAGLGAVEVRLLDMMEAYGTIAHNGQYIGLNVIISITDSNGNQIPLPSRSEPDQVFSPAVAYLLQDILSDDVARAPVFGRNSRLTFPEFSDRQVIAAKSGTTEGAANNAVRDLWTMGFTSNRVVGVWLGTFDDSDIFENYQGSTAAAPLWNDIMRVAIDEEAPRQFQPPDNGTVYTAQVCPLTGAVNGNCTTSLRNEIFAQGRGPADASNPNQGIVVNVLVDSWTGLLANENCPQNQTTATFVNIGNTAAIEWINNTNTGRAYAQAVNLAAPVQPVPNLACDLNTPIPTVNVTNPVPNEVVQGEAYAIRGQVVADNFARYEFQYAPAGTENYAPLPGISAVTQQQPNPGSTLATWNTQLIENGAYTLRLAVFSSQGGFLYRTVPVQVNNPLPTATPVPTPLPTVAPVQPTPAPPIEGIPFDPIPGLQTAPPGPTPTLDENPLG